MDVALMSYYEDVMATLFDAILDISDAPDVLVQPPSEIASMSVALDLAESMLRERRVLWQSNARLLLPEWTDHRNRS